MSDHEKNDGLAWVGFGCFIAGFVMLSINVSVGVILIAVAACIVGFFHGKGPQS